METKTRDEIGQAYGFFDCNATKEEIQGEMPEIRARAKTPKNLELSLMKTSKFSLIECSKDSKDPQLLELIHGDQIYGSNYAIKVNCPNISNKQAADELAEVLNGLYNRYKENSFRGEVIYKQGEDYLFRE